MFSVTLVMLVVVDFVLFIWATDESPLSESDTFSRWKGAPNQSIFVFSPPRTQLKELNSRIFLYGTVVASDRAILVSVLTIHGDLMFCCKIVIKCGMSCCDVIVFIAAAI